MKRTGHLWEKILEYDNLIKAACDAVRGKSDKKEIKIFKENLCDNISIIKTQLENNEFEIGNYKTFKIYDPKERLICAASLKERILHHAVINVVHDIFERKMIFDSYATRIGKGTHKAIKRVKDFMKNYSYYVKLDVKKYFDSIDHIVMKKILCDIIKDKNLLNLLSIIIESYSTTPGKGLPIGNLTSQYFANLYLTGLDHYMKENVKVKAYVRYMDDVVMLGTNKDDIKRYNKEFETYARHNLKLTLKPAVYGKCENGIVFLGYKIYKDFISLSRKGKQRSKRKIINCYKLYNKGNLTQNQLHNTLITLISHLKYAKSYNFRNKFFRFIKDEVENEHIPA